MGKLLKKAEFTSSNVQLGKEGEQGMREKGASKQNWRWY